MCLSLQSRDKSGIEMAAVVVKAEKKKVKSGEIGWVWGTTGNTRAG